MREGRRQGCLPQQRRQGDAQAITGTRTSSSHAEQSLLHVGLSWSEGPAWPFIAKSSKCGAVVIPFDQDEDNKLQDLVLIIPYGYLPSTTLESWQNLLDQHHGRQGLRCMLNFGDSTHFWVKRMRATCLIALVSFTITNDIPLVVTLTAAQH